MNLRKDHYRNLLNPSRSAKQRCIHLCLKTGSCSHESAVGKTASGASRLLVVVTAGVGVLPMASGSMSTHSGSVLSSMFAQKGRQCYNIQSSVTGYLSWEKNKTTRPKFVIFFTGRAHMAQGHFYLLPCNGSKRQTTAFVLHRGTSHPASPPRDAPLFFHFTTVILSMTTIIGGRTLVRCPGVAAVTFFSWKPQGGQRKKLL